MYDSLAIQPIYPRCPYLFAANARYNDVELFTNKYQAKDFCQENVRYGEPKLAKI